MLFTLLRMPFQPQNAGEPRFTLQVEHPLFRIALSSVACPGHHSYWNDSGIITFIS